MMERSKPSPIRDEKDVPMHGEVGAGWAIWQLNQSKATLSMSAMSKIPLFLLVCFGVSQSVFAQEPETAWFTLEVGDAWTYQDDHGTVTIRVVEEVEIELLPTPKVSWFQGKDESPYQTEFWRKDGTDYVVVGRGFGNRELMFETPYLFLKEGLKPGDNWEAKPKLMGRELTLTFTVEKEEMVKTKLGEFTAIKVVVNGPGQSIERWYTPAIGMVKEKTRITLGGRTSPGNEKVLIDRVEGRK
ncbi:MAG: hypothetical protein AAGH89_17360 [Verrucomicrobiota bacterium]